MQPRRGIGTTPEQFLTPTDITPAFGETLRPGVENRECGWSKMQGRSDGAAGGLFGRAALQRGKYIAVYELGTRAVSSLTEQE